LADSEHVEVLRRGPRSWNDWLRQNGTTVPNLIRSLSAAERQMGVMNGGPVNLASVRLRSASLRFATLSGANLAGADLSGADLTDARLDGANLTNADLSHALHNRTDSPVPSSRGRDWAARAWLSDAFTLLPSHLEHPLSWSDPADPEQDLTDVRAPYAPSVTTRGRGGTMSWLVGGFPAAPEA
jgi:hypothetical protein